MSTTRFKEIEQRTGVPAYVLEDCPELLNIGSIKLKIDPGSVIEDGSAKIFATAMNGDQPSAGFIIPRTWYSPASREVVDRCQSLVGFNTDTSFGSNWLKSVMYENQSTPSEDNFPIERVAMGIGYFRDEAAYEAHVSEYLKKSEQDTSWMEMDGSIDEITHFDCNDGIDIYIQEKKPFDTPGGKATQFELIYKQFEEMIFPEHGNYLTWINSFWYTEQCPRNINYIDYIGFTTMVDGYYVHYYLKTERLQAYFFGVKPSSK